MELVPFAFCESVIVLLKNPASMKQPLASSLWQTAIAREAETRIIIDVTVGFKDGNWSFEISSWSPQKKYRNWTFEDLQKMDRKNLRLRYLAFYSFSATNRSSFEEILRILTLTDPRTSLSELRLSYIYTYPPNDLLQLLSLYRNTPIYILYTWGNSQQVDEFMTNLLRSNMLRYVALHEANVSDTVQAQLEEFALSKSFTYIEHKPVNLKFSQRFFEKLFAKPLRNSCSFTSEFDFSLDDLKNFRPELQINKADKNVHWIREDGVAVEAKKYGYGILKFTFTRYKTMKPKC